MKLLVIEQWHLGDLALASPFIVGASQKYLVSVIARSVAVALGAHFWPDARVYPFEAPWTAFERKYHLWRWPWKKIDHLIKDLRSEKFEIAVSARCDPRDHVLMAMSGAKRRIGFPRLGSQLLLTESLERGSAFTHRFSQWKRLADVLGVDVQMPTPFLAKERDLIVIHTGARRVTRIWPLKRYERLIRRLRDRKYNVKVLCDADQLEFWRARGERVVVPGPISELVTNIARAVLFIGNDSGPGHIAAACGVPTFTIFGPQLPQLFAPIHPKSDWIEGGSCEFKPCYDHCRFPVPHCLLNVDEEAVWAKVDKFVSRVLVNSNNDWGAVQNMVSTRTSPGEGN